MEGGKRGRKSRRRRLVRVKDQRQETWLRGCEVYTSHKCKWSFDGADDDRWTRSHSWKDQWRRPTRELWKGTSDEVSGVAFFWVTVGKTEELAAAKPWTNPSSFYESRTVPSGTRTILQYCTLGGSIGAGFCNTLLAGLFEVFSFELVLAQLPHPHVANLLDMIGEMREKLEHEVRCRDVRLVDAWTQHD